MAIIKISAKGVVVKFGTTATPTAVVEGMKTVGFDPGDREEIDMTNHGSTTTKEHVDAGLRETPTLTVEMIYDPADAVHESIRAAHAAGTLVYATLVLPDAGNATYVMSGYVRSAPFSNMATNSALAVNWTFRARAAETFTA